MYGPTEKKYKLWDDFLIEFPIENLHHMTLEKYISVGVKNTFTWWMESGLDELGSIWGGSAFKFGIYERKNIEKEFTSQAYKSSDKYAWLAKYGNDPDEAFRAIKGLIVKVCEAARKGDLAAIDKIDIGKTYKWKIAFHYQDRHNSTIINIFLEDWLKQYLSQMGIQSPPSNFAKLNEEVMKLRGEMDLFEYGDNVWQVGTEAVGYKILKKYFLDAIPGFNSFKKPPESYLTQERNYKEELCSIYKKEFAPIITALPVDSSSLEQLGVDLAKLFTRKLKADNKPQNLVGWRYFEFANKLNDQQKIEFAQAVAILVDDNKVLDDRIPLFIKLLKKFENEIPKFQASPAATRSLISFFLFLDNPSEHFFIKTDEVNDLLEIFKLPKFSKGDLSPEEYRRVQQLAKKIYGLLKQDGIEPQDMIDVQSFIWMAINQKKGISPVPENNGTTKPEIVKGRKPTMNKHPLNQILYGPPGTGKTYITAQIAIEICDGIPITDRKVLIDRYRELVDTNRISFVSFHQSFSYEEFIEGIRPDTVKDSDDLEQLIYRVEDGLFKTVCKWAKDAQGVKIYSGGVSNLTDRNFLKMSVGGKYDPDVEDFCFNNNYLALGKGGDIDFSILKKDKNWKKSRDAIKALMQKSDPAYADKSYDIQAIYFFKDWMDIGDIVIVSKGLNLVQAIGEVTGEYEYHHELMGKIDYRHFRKVKWLIKNVEIPVEKIHSKIFSQQTIYTLNREALNIDYLSEILSPDINPSENAVPEKYVLIIDEINRANISKVFGELITLLEPDKRLGADNEVTVKLPYSREKFGVPRNLYIVGTMNTADRSLALLDTALRRRFEFQEMMPDYSVLQDMMVGRIIIKSLLQFVNKRIEALYDREHTIGHAFFIPLKADPTVDNLSRIFEHKIIPLLAEYFFEDWQKIRLVLGDNQKKDKSTQFIIEEEILANGDPLFGNGNELAIYGLDQIKNYKRNPAALMNPDSYIAIYDPKFQSEYSETATPEVKGE
ncbi:MAG: AAA family ATPase [Desulfobulbaceae bacterium]